MHQYSHGDGLGFGTRDASCVWTLAKCQDLGHGNTVAPINHHRVVLTALPYTHPAISPVPSSPLALHLNVFLAQTSVVSRRSPPRHFSPPTPHWASPTPLMTQEHPVAFSLRHAPRSSDYLYGHSSRAAVTECSHGALASEGLVSLNSRRARIWQQLSSSTASLCSCSRGPVWPRVV
jgi:hypothetical protein